MVVAPVGGNSWAPVVTSCAGAVGAVVSESAGSGVGVAGDTAFWSRASASRRFWATTASTVGRSSSENWAGGSIVLAVDLHRR